MTAQHIFQLAEMLSLSSGSDNQELNNQELNSIVVALKDFAIEGEYDDALAEKIKQFWLRALPPIIFAEDQNQVTFDLHLPIEFVTEDLIWEIRDCNGLVESGVFTPIEWQLNGIYHLHDMEMQSYQINLEQALSTVDYQLVILDQGSEEPLGETRLICAPAVLLTNQLHSAKAEQARETVTSASSTALMRSYIKHALCINSIEGDVKQDHMQALNLLESCYAAQHESITKSSFFSWLTNLVDNQQSVEEKKTILAPILLTFPLRESETFADWLLAEYKLKHCVTNAGYHGVNSHQLREDGYQLWSEYLKFITKNTDIIVIDQPLAFAQEWLNVADAGIWQTHEFHELMSLLIFYCQQNQCACYYQADDLPEELVSYLDDRGIQQY